MEEDVVSAGVGVDAGLGAGVDAPPNIENPMFTLIIQNHLLTCMLSPVEFLGFLKVHLLSVSSAAGAASASAGASAGAGAAGVHSIRIISSWGNHATAVCFVKRGGDQEGRVTACLQFKDLTTLDGVGVVTNRYDSPQGVVQIVFPKLVEKVREIMVLGNVPLDPASWASWTMTIMNSVFAVLNQHGITAGRNELERKLAASFQRIRELSLKSKPLEKQIELREIRVKYCDLLLDLLRDDLLQNYGGTVQQGLLGTINIHNNNDDYTTHNGKPVTDPTLRQAAYNVLFLINIDIGGRIYTVHMDIDRPAVEREIAGKRFQSVSYWVGGVLEFIHTNKAAFVERVIAALSAFTARTPGVGAEQAEMFKQSVIDHLNGASADIPLQHDAFILSCKSVTLIQDSHIATPVPTNDNTVGINHQGAPFSSFKRFSFPGREKDITGVNFEVYCEGVLKSTPVDYEHWCHFPTYDFRPIDRIIEFEVGDSLDSQPGAPYTGPTEDSQAIQEDVLKNYVDVDVLIDFRATELAELAKLVEAAGAGAEGAGAEGSGAAITLAQDLTTAVKEAPASAPASGLLGFLTNPTSVTKKVVGYICDSYNFWMNPFKARRAGSSSLLHDKGLDIQLLDLVSLGLEQQISKIDIKHMVDHIVTEIRDSDRFLEFVPRNSDRIMLFAAGAAAAGGGRRSRRRSVKKKTRRIYYSKRQQNFKKNNISRKPKYSRRSRRSRRRRSYSRKNGWQ
jgi:hypothetical protein